ncbi:hypothetical protein [Deinococcus sonorensis]|uniref:Secreted protein n=2 Tax=Deinococcus sonorensis TaxID=309891 RepID=A0AAU7UGA5_9DEIO
MLMRTAQMLLFAALLAVPASLTSPDALAQPRVSESDYCKRLFSEIALARSDLKDSRKVIADNLARLNQQAIPNALQAQALAKSPLLAALYTGDAERLNALVQLYLGTCVIPAAPK